MKERIKNESLQGEFEKMILLVVLSSPMQIILGAGFF